MHNRFHYILTQLTSLFFNSAFILISFSVFISSAAWGGDTASYVNGNISYGRYYLEEPEGTYGRSFFQSGKAYLSISKAHYGVIGSYYYSDIPDWRPVSYKQYSRLSLAHAYYSAPSGSWEATVGRSFLPVINGSMYYDGGSFTLRKGYKFKAELFGGWQAPSDFDNDLMSFKAQSQFGGLKLRSTPNEALGFMADAIFSEDDNRAGLQAQADYRQKTGIDANVVYSSQNGLSHSQAGTYYQFRVKDILRAQWSWDATKLDSSRSYEYFIQSSHQLISAGYYLSLHKWVQAAVDGGIYIFDDGSGQMVEGQLFILDGVAKVRKEWRTETNVWQSTISYGLRPWGPLVINVLASYWQYDSPVSSSEDAVHLGSSIEYEMIRGLEIRIDNEFVHNHLYSKDYRFYVSLKYRFSRAY